MIDSMVAHGMRAALKDGNLLTGQKYIAVDVVKGRRARNASPGTRTRRSSRPPPGGLEEITDSIGSVAKKLDKVPFDQISAHLIATMATLDQTLKRTDHLLSNVDSSVAPQVTATLKEAEDAMKNAKDALAEGGPLDNDLGDALRPNVARREIPERSGRLSRASPGDADPRQAGGSAMSACFPRAFSARAAGARRHLRRAPRLSPLAPRCSPPAPAPPIVSTPLSTLPDTARPAAAEYSAHVVLRVAIPATVDRRQMIVDAPGGEVLVLEHERWVAALSDLVSQTLAGDLERRRADVLVAGPAFDQAGMKPVQIRVDIVRMSAHRGAQASLEAHWRIVDPQSSADAVGGGSFHGADRRR